MELANILSSTTYKALLIDLDGTIIDSHEVIYRSLNETFLEVAGVGFRRDWWQERVGQPLDALYTFALREIDRPDIAMDTLVDVYRRHQKIHELDVVPYEGVIEALEQLVAIDLPMAVVTTKHREATIRQMDRAGVSGLIKVIVSGDEVSYCKPHPEPYLLGAKKLGIDIADCVALGDTRGDILSARDAGALAVAATWGAANMEQLLAAEPHRVISRPDEISSLLTRA